MGSKEFKAVQARFWSVLDWHGEGGHSGLAGHNWRRPWLGEEFGVLMKDLDVVEVPDVSDWKGWGMLLQAGPVQPFVVMSGLGRLESQGCSGVLKKAHRATE
jgi:hypothetical protein